MKKLLFFLIFSVLFTGLTAQAPDGFNYQAVATNASGSPIANKTIQVKISILSDSTGFRANGTGTYIWEEQQSVVTNLTGLFSLIVGDPAATRIQGSAATFSEINWKTGPLFIGVKIMPPSSTWKNMGTSRLMSVPYSKVTDGIAEGSKVKIVSDDDAKLDSALFEVKRKDGQTVFAVYPEAVNIYVPRSGKGVKGGFAVGGFDATKADPQDYFRVTPDSVRVYIDPNPAKGVKGGFAVGGYDVSKGINDMYFNLTGATSVNTVDASPQVLWYPNKNAFLAGNVHIGHVDSVGSYSTALGYQSRAIGNYSQAFGYKATAFGDYSTSIGKKSIAGIYKSKHNAFALGNGTQATGEDSYAFGSGAKAQGSRSFAFGSVGIDSLGNPLATPTTASGNYSTALGMGAQATNMGSLAFGTSSSSGAYASMALGFYSSVISGADYGVAIGYYAKASGKYGHALGLKAQALGTGTLALGMYSYSYGNYSTAVGYGANSTNPYSIALGYYAQTTGDYSASLGRSAKSTGPSSVAIGYSARTTATGTGAGSFGYYATANGPYSVAVGPYANTGATANNASALGYYANATGATSLSLGYSSDATNTYSVAMGYDAQSTGDKTLALGYNPTASGTGAVAMGYTAQATGTYSMALGYNPTATNSYTTAVGYQASATGTYAAAFGNSLASGSKSLALGSYYSYTYYRRIFNKFGGWLLLPVTINVQNKAIRDYSVAVGNGNNSEDGGISLGSNNMAMANGSVAIGHSNQSDTTFSFSAGYGNLSRGYAAFALGENVTAEASNSFVIGAYNQTSSSYNKYEWIETDPLFVIGNGDATTGHDAFRIMKNGGTYLYPENAYAGLWITTTNDANFVGTYQYGMLSRIDRNKAGVDYYSGYFYDSGSNGTYHGLYADTREGGSIDVAEYIYDSKDNCEPADVVVADANNKESIIKSSKQYQTGVLGVISTKPHMTMGMELVNDEKTGEPLKNNKPAARLALTGRVPVNVCGENGEIKPGDYLTTSSMEGYAMKWTLLDVNTAKDFDDLKRILAENEKRRNAIIGKAVESFSGTGTGKIMVLISLQ